MNDHELHVKSVRLGKKFATLWHGSTDHTAIDKAREDYIESRRAIKRDQFGERHGAYQAYKASQGMLDDYAIDRLVKNL